MLIKYLTKFIDLSYGELALRKRTYFKFSHLREGT